MITIITSHNKYRNFGQSIIIILHLRNFSFLPTKITAVKTKCAENPLKYLSSSGSVAKGSYSSQERTYSGMSPLAVWYSMRYASSGFFLHFKKINIFKNLR